MATVDVAVSSDLSPDKAWALASDLRRFDEWLTIFGGWRSEVPSQIEVGTCVSSCIKVKGFRNIIHWRVTRYDEPKLIELSRSGPPVGFASVPDHRGAGPMSPRLQISGGRRADRRATQHPNRQARRRVLQSDVRKSVNNLAALR